MNIELIKSTKVDGKQRQAGWQGDVNKIDARFLISIGKAKSLETTALSLTVSMSPELQNILDEKEREFEEEAEAIIEANAQLIVDRDNLKSRFEMAILDINSMSIKDLKEKYKIDEEGNND